jgi:MOSC domain-containing protein YiiM
MRIVSVNVGQPREVHATGRVVLTSIFKAPVNGRVAVRRHNIEGDRQSDLRVHGGPHKAVYAYPSEHYPYWREALAEADLSWGAFGENLALEGLLEDDVHIGDQYRIGSAVLTVTQPRMPCFKLNLRFGRSDMVKNFWNSGFSGLYFSISEEGYLEAGDKIELLERPTQSISIADVVRLYKGEAQDEDLLQRMLRAPLSGRWKEEIRERWEEQTLPLLG